MNEGAKLSPVVVIGLVFACASGIAVILAGTGTRLEWWTYPLGFLILRWAAYTALGAAIICAVGIVVSPFGHAMYGSAALALAGILIGLSVAYVPWSWMHRARHVPAIHDVTTDTSEPPRFEAILPLRGNASNPVEYGGPDVADLQHQAYPDIKPLHLDLPVTEAFEKALTVARGLDWNIVDANETSNCIEAVDTTFWFGFRDDIVIRVRPEGEGSRIDIRSLSRFGKSDIGTNAARIRKFLARMRK